MPARSSTTPPCNATASYRHRKIVGLAIAQHVLDLNLVQRLHHQVSDFAIELLAQHW
jgi:hypothetical protein